MRLVRVLAVLAGIAAALVIAFFAVGFLLVARQDSRPLCINKKLAEVLSPDQRLKAVVFERRCEWATGRREEATTNVSIVPPDNALWNEPGNVIAAALHHGEPHPMPEDAPQMTVQLRSPTQLLVLRDARAGALFEHPLVAGVAIEEGELSP